MKAAETTKGRSMEEAEAAWVAGIYEGEGCLNKRTDKRDGVVTWEIRITMADQDVIEKLARLTGVGRVRFQCRRVPHHKDQHLWLVSRRVDIAHVLGHIQGHLGLRRHARAMEFLEWFAHTHRVTRQA